MEETCATLVGLLLYSLIFYQNLLQFKYIYIYIYIYIYMYIYIHKGQGIDVTVVGEELIHTNKGVISSK